MTVTTTKYEAVGGAAARGGFFVPSPRLLDGSNILRLQCYRWLAGAPATWSLVCLGLGYVRVVLSRPSNLEIVNHGYFCLMILPRMAINTTILFIPRSIDS